ncbi:MAG: hypothetical protein NTU98_07715 [Bacteroidetes bacterium]|nr:hypothetical protein [Bacteroidota bacterium]
MEKEEFLPDDFLKELFRKQPLESPGDQFVERVMNRIVPAPEAVTEKKSFLHYLRTSWPFVLLALVGIVILMTSDLPFTKYIPGKEYFSQHLFPYISSLFSGLKPLFANSKITSLVVMAIVAGGLFFGLDMLLSRKHSVGHQTSN